MFTIRKEQMAAFGPLGKKVFEDRVVDHLKKAFPQQSKALGDEKLRETIQYGTQRAAAYRIVAERDVCKYIDLMVLYGRDFDKDPNLPWRSLCCKTRPLRIPQRKSTVCSKRQGSNLLMRGPSVAHSKGILFKAVSKPLPPAPPADFDSRPAINWRSK